MLSVHILINAVQNMVHFHSFLGVLFVLGYDYAGACYDQVNDIAFVVTYSSISPVT